MAETDARAETPGQESQRVFLVVVDDTDEMRVALRFACRRAMHTGGRVALLYVLEPNDFQHWMTVGDLIRQEARGEAEKLLQRAAAEAYELSGRIATLYLKEGSPRETLLKLIEQDPSISILVLGANTGQGGPGPLVSALTSKMMGKLRVPVTVVPGNLEGEDVDSIA
ncbi:Nucleotide-binding universal stress protein, UspA family [Limimonas halophila]|uniref:Nucleotide-binding universal stress protein, UspA family n=1 Tax=Limimonas halophila TaxID=1082479 RepID=A0A1G7SKX5_9PROT|nr:universal stress protein [Limimonas halophila]SDG23737.1 Nucleotide-binding universal stress protein, UspA family [Limimonas halophila]